MKSSAIALLFLTLLCSMAAAADQPETVGGMSSEEALKLGERMYREGILPSGEPMRALVSEDIEVDGTMFSCESCHLRSGMGSIEGTVITLPTCGSWLYKPMVGREMKPLSQERISPYLDPPPFREAYTDRLVARAIWLGRDPNDREFNWVMPRYTMSTRDMEILVHYLRNLSAEFSPGVDEKTIRFATVVSHDVAEQDRFAMLETLKAHVRDHNSQSRPHERRAQHGPFNMEELYSPYRRYSLAVWELGGPPETWRAQLEDYYNEAPVFALLGGITTGDWAPIHRFSEDHRIPCFFPVTEYPVISDSDWYTLYFSKGYYQEGEAAARFLRRAEDLARTVPVLQVYRATKGGRDAARGFRDARASMDLDAPVELEVGNDEVMGAAFWSRLVEQHPGVVLALWLPAGDLEGISRLGTTPQPPMVFVSEGMLGDEVLKLPEEVRAFTYITHPHSFPEDEERSRLATQGWLKAKGLPVTDFEIQSKMYLLGWMLAGVVKKMRDDFYRDYFLDRVDMMRDQYYSIAVYPRLSFGPGQRYASKGCYVTQLTQGSDPRLEKRSGWVIH
jgi:hypothetical protein